MTATVEPAGAGTPQGLLIDIVRCIGCGGCVQACQEAHGLPVDSEVRELSARAYTVLHEPRAEHYVRQLCRHCDQPSCASACPVGAFVKTPAGPVTYDASRCLGCRYCMLACPFGVPRYEWDRPVPAVRKCDLCADRLAQGRPSACAEICPAEATLAGTRTELLAEARRRLAAEPDKYYPKIYGEHEVGGTAVLFLSPLPFEELGFAVLGPTPPPELTWAALEKIPGVVSLGGLTLGGLWWITQRRRRVALAAAQEVNHAR